MQGDSGEEAAEYKQFVKQCIAAFNILRKHSNHLINLFQLVRTAHAHRVFCLPIPLCLANRGHGLLTALSRGADAVHRDS
jgi:hypothetical protein